MVINKRGITIDSEMTIKVFLVVAGLVVALVLLWLIYGAFGTGDREACELSINTPFVPLNCKTQKFCITSKLWGEDCPQFLGEDYEKIKIDGNFDDPEDRLRMIAEIEGEMAEKMLDCWSMTGKGGKDVFGDAARLLGFGVQEPNCIICSRVGLAKDVTDAGIQSQINLAQYLASYPVPYSNYANYIEAFTNGETSTYPRIGDLDRGFAEIVGSVSTLEDEEDRVAASKDLNEDISGGSGDQVAMIFAQNRPSNWENTATSWLGITTGGVVMVPWGWPKVIALVGGVGIGAVASASTWQNQRAAAAYCGDIITQSDEGTTTKTGCSIIQAIDYNPGDINALCNHNIRSIP